MFIPFRLIGSSLLTLSIFSAVVGQSENTGGDQPAVTIVTASQSTERVRFTAPATVVRMHLQVYSADGQIMFDVSSRGNVLDWTLQDSAGQPLGNGSYLNLVTVKSLSGKLSQKTGVLTVNDQLMTLTEAGELSPAQQQAVGPLEDRSALTIIQREEAPAVTTIANNGTDGQITRNRGSLSFRLGEFFSGKDKEQMRLTEAGNLGIGVDNPEVKLDVAGDIRASGAIRATNGIAFSDGTVQTTGLSGRTDANGDLVSTAVGTGTENQIAKWVDNSGTLGDSGITETSAGLVGIGTTNPETLLQIGPNAGYGSTTGVLVSNDLIGSQYDRAFQVAPRQTANPANNSILMYAVPTVNSGVTVPNQFGFFMDARQGAGAIASYAAIATGRMGSLGANNNTHLLMGSLTIPGDDYAIYDNTGSRSFFKGNIGIGTASATQQVHISGAGGATHGLRITDNSAAKAFLVRGDGTNFVTGTESTNAYTFQTNNQERMRIDSNGDIGIGTTTPGYRFDVQGGQINASGGLCIAGDCKTAWSEVGGAGVWTAIGNDISNTNTGNVGIGTTNPIFNDDGVTGANVGKWVAIDGGNAGGSAYLGLGGTIPNVNDRVGLLNFYNLAMGGVDNRTAHIASYNDGALGKGNLVFSTTPNNVGPVARMTIGSEGGVGINHSAAANVGLQLQGATADSSTYGLIVRNSDDTPYFLARSNGKVYVATTDPNSVFPPASNASFFVGQTGQFSVNASGDAVQRSIQLISGSKPTCDLSNRGKFWYVGGGAGVKDTVEVCGKDAADVFAWRTLY